MEIGMRPIRLYQQVLECTVDILAIYLSKNALPKKMSFSVNLDEHHERIVPTSMRHCEVELLLYGVVARTCVAEINIT
jgi:hypothetical protein